MFLRSPGSVQLEIRTGYQTHPKEWLPGKQKSSIDHSLNNDLTDLRAFISKFITFFADLIKFLFLI